MNTMALIFFFPAAGLLLGAAIQDLQSRTIANGWSLALLALFVIAYPLGALAGPLLSHLIHFALALAVGMLLFALGWFGGGDAKLYAAIALWFPLAQALYLFVAVALFGMVLALIHLAARFMPRREGAATPSARQSQLAYGVAIALGAVLALSQTIA